jgi:predicted DsbA family dithiol-disulfide isomerase
VEPEVRDALYRAYWEEGRDIGRIDVLTEIGAAFGLDATEIRITLDIEGFAEAVARDREAALRLGIQGTPGMIVGTGERAIFLLGAHSYAELSDAIASY